VPLFGHSFFPPNKNGNNREIEVQTMNMNGNDGQFGFTEAIQSLGHPKYNAN